MIRPRLRWLAEVLYALAGKMVDAAHVLHRPVPAWPPREHDRAVGCKCHWSDEFMVAVLRDDCPLPEHKAALKAERAVGLA